MYTFGLIGSGNMGGAIAHAVSRTTKDGLITNRSEEKAKTLAESLGMSFGSPADAANSRFLFFGVKPHQITDVLQTVLPHIPGETVLISMAAGVSIEQLQAVSGSRPVIRIMPNTPVSAGQGVVLYSVSKEVTENQLAAFLDLMKAAGKLYPIEESLMDVGAAVSGCGPAFVYLLLDAMADGGVTCGLSRPDALNFAAQTMLGAAQMVLETGKHPDQLKNEVCSPGGSTIQGVRVLEQRAVRAAMMDAVIAANDKNAALGK